MKFLYPDCPPLQAKCVFETLEFFIDNLFIYEQRFRNYGTSIHVEAKFESVLQFQFFAPRIWEKSQKKKKTPLIVIPNYGMASKANTILFHNVKPLAYDFEDRLCEVRFVVRPRDGNFYTIGK